MPAKAWITNGFAAKLERNMAIAVMISMEGVMTPKVAARPPENLLFISYKGGYIDSNHAGRALADGKIVHQLFFGTPFLFSATSRCRIGSMAYPPPKVTAPILKK